MLEATDRKAVGHIVRIPVDSRVGSVQVPSPSRRRTGRGRRPQVQVGTKIVEGGISIAVAATNMISALDLQSLMRYSVTIRFKTRK